jgi:protein-S-isoprenylcysteine O-methyltransferase Ste14
VSVVPMRALTSIQLSTWLPVLAECAIVLANNGLLPTGRNERALALLIDTPSRTLVAQTLPPVLIGAAVLATAGTSIRMAAYTALGRQLTYGVAIRDDYALVTAFPYNLVRHPSYLGIISTMAGAYLSLTPRDGWARAVFGPWLVSKPLSLEKIAAVAAAAGVVTSNVLAVMMFRLRLNREDVMLRKLFGRQWDEWAERVPNQIIPYMW